MADTQIAILDVMKQCQNFLTQKGLSVQIFVNHDVSGYGTITKNQTDTVYSLYIEMGPGINSTHKTVGLGQIFDENQPNLTMITMIDVDENGKVTDQPVLFNVHNDYIWSTCILPIMYTAFNVLDPERRFRGQVIQRYTGTRIVWRDFVPAIFYTLRLLIGRGMTGQCATIACDFDDPLTHIVANILKPISNNPKSKVTILSATKGLSPIKISVPNPHSPNAALQTIESTTALDTCFLIAQKYLNTP